MRACIIETTAANAPILKRHLPPDVRVTGDREPFYGGNLRLRLEGDGLPPWCNVIDSLPYQVAVADLLPDGTLRLVPGAGIPVQQIPENIKE